MLSRMFILRWKKVPRGEDLSPNITDNQLTNDHGEVNELEDKILGCNNYNETDFETSVIARKF